MEGNPNTGPRSNGMKANGQQDVQARETLAVKRQQRGRDKGEASRFGCETCFFVLFDQGLMKPSEGMEGYEDRVQGLGRDESCCEEVSGYFLLLLCGVWMESASGKKPSDLFKLEEMNSLNCIFTALSDHELIVRQDFYEICVFCVAEERLTSQVNNKRVRIKSFTGKMYLYSACSPLFVLFLSQCTLLFFVPSFLFSFIVPRMFLSIPLLHSPFQMFLLLVYFIGNTGQCVYLSNSSCHLHSKQSAV